MAVKPTTEAVQAVEGPEMLVPIQQPGWGDTAGIDPNIGKNPQWLIQIGWIEKPSRGTHQVYDMPSLKYVDVPNPAIRKPKVLRNSAGEAVVFTSQQEAWDAIKDGRVLEFWQKSQAKAAQAEKARKEQAQQRQFAARGLTAADLVALAKGAN